MALSKRESNHSLYIDLQKTCEGHVARIESLAATGKQLAGMNEQLVLKINALTEKLAIVDRDNEILCDNIRAKNQLIDKLTADLAQQHKSNTAAQMMLESRVEVKEKVIRLLDSQLARYRRDTDFDEGFTDTAGPSDPAEPFTKPDSIRGTHGRTILRDEVDEAPPTSNFWDDVVDKWASTKYPHAVVHLDRQRNPRDDSSVLMTFDIETGNTTKPLPAGVYAMRIKSDEHVPSRKVKNKKRKNKRSKK